MRLRRGTQSKKVGSSRGGVALEPSDRSAQGMVIAGSRGTVAVRMAKRWQRKTPGLDGNAEGGCQLIGRVGGTRCGVQGQRKAQRESKHGVSTD